MFFLISLSLSLIFTPFIAPVGRDVFSRVLYGGQHTLLIAAGATGIAVILGLALGFLAYMGQLTERLVTVLVNALLAIPGLIIAFVVLTLLGRGDLPLMLATGFAQTAPFARLVSTVMKGVETELYVEAAESLGASRWRIFGAHILPNIGTPLLAYVGAVFSYCILNSAALSFLGLGAEPGIPDWGVMLAEGRTGFRVAPWVSFFPGILITLTVAAVNRLVDGLSTRQT
jgi:ABC-type dipeptide/oligopeptide/nickel transport system permease subunit